MSWQPIETAPKDGTEIDLWYPDLGRQPAAHWDTTGLGFGWCWPNWNEGRLETVIRPNIAPTHWMPIPEPPGAT
jgi:hypothetical protein